MIKQLITWLYERYCKEKPISEEQSRRYREIWDYATEIAYPFQMAAWLGQPKPPYPLHKGEECPQPLKDKLDKIYETNKRDVTFEGVGK